MNGVAKKVVIDLDKDWKFSLHQQELKRILTLKEQRNFYETLEHEKRF